MTLTTITFDADEWVLVPRKATDNMVEAARMQIMLDVILRNGHTLAIKKAYESAVSAAPQPPAQDKICDHVFITVTNLSTPHIEKHAECAKCGYRP